LSLSDSQYIGLRISPIHDPDQQPIGNPECGSPRIPHPLVQIGAAKQKDGSPGTVPQNEDPEAESGFAGEHHLYAPQSMNPLYDTLSNPSPRSDCAYRYDI